MHDLLLHSTMLTVLFILTHPILTTMNPIPLMMGWNMLYAKASVQLAFKISLIPLAIFMNYGMEATTTNFTWTNIAGMDIDISLVLDMYSLTFIPISLFVTWSILEFANWYMSSDPYMNRFFKYLLVFLLTMLTLVTANNMFQLFVGWESVGIMSFMLIGWWFARPDANTAALQAIIFNRVGDIGLMLALAWLATYLATWNIQEMTIQTKNPPLLPLFGLILASAGKSAQFGLHPWLPAAMEGPTPVSALLHSSTMVVAGVFLLIRLHPLLKNNETALTICLCLGALTTLFTALCALTQNDIKKIVAFSTSSQLGLMMVTIGLNQPQLAFLHISTHAFFKAMLFLCSGAIIHNLNNEQDIRKMGGVQKMLPTTATCLTIGNLALTGTPFLSGFYSKDTIIETMNNSHLNAWALLLTIFATMLTATYTLRMIFYVQMNTPRTTTSTMNEIPPTLTNPLIRLAIGSLLTGLILMTSILPTKPTPTTMPTTMKLSAMIVAILGTLFALQIMKKTTWLTTTKQSKHHNFSSQLGFFNPTLHRLIPFTSLFTGQTLALHINDLLWLEKAGPKGLVSLNLPTVKANTLAQKGLMKLYLSIFIITSACFITVLWT
uniref:NADH-ubiquinone oxidoreductase chain 5 n=2 Tax=Darevskia TaxID=122330 RepID=A0A6B7FBM2_DARSA|nr:NADH dehydrogenase subunit 5 [Darevskia saxicola]YP_009910946.1 NADH dehydrogenase subunit 5 [Darevskia brauneri]QBA55858.1 NADH dehydrogenase subunit 5 [Darevskia saxicola]QDP70175.1 NADH dehydrogenase subunit 5 [Darevskia brauneri]